MDHLLSNFEWVTTLPNARIPRLPHFAVGVRNGMIEASGRGTLFLDEIGDLSMFSERRSALSSLE